MGDKITTGKHLNIIDIILNNDDPDVIPIIKSKGIYIDQDSIEDLKFLNLKSYVSRSGILVSHVWSWGVKGIDFVIMMHIIDGHSEEYHKLIDDMIS